MKTTQRVLLLAALSPAVLLFSNCAKTEDAKSLAQNAASDLKAAAFETWDGVKDYTFEKRDDFAASLGRMSDRSDATVRDLNARRTALTGAAAKDRDSATQEFNDARTALKAQLAGLPAVTTESWNDAKAKVAQAWQRLDAAFVKVKAVPMS